MPATISHLPQLPLTPSLDYAAPLFRQQKPRVNPVEKKEDKACFSALFTLFNAGFLLLLFFLLPFLAVNDPAPATELNPYEKQVLLEDNVFFLKTLDFIPEAKEKGQAILRMSDLGFRK